MKLKISLVVLLLLGSFAFVRAEVATEMPAAVTPEKRVEIDRMLKLTGMENLVDRMMTQLIAGLRSNMKDVPEEFWTKFAKKISASEMIEMIVPLYDKYYSLEDLRAVNEFYSSPAGQRVLNTLPQLMQESMVVGQKWGTKVGQQAAEEAMAEIKARKEAESGAKL